MRVNADMKYNRMVGVQNQPWPAKQADIAQVEHATISATGNALLSTRAKLYWISYCCTGDAGSAELQDSHDATLILVGSKYFAKDKDGDIQTYDPPREIKVGVYATITTCEVTLGYFPIAKLLPCKLIVMPVLFKNLVCRATIYQVFGITNLISTVTVVYAATALNLVSRLTVRSLGDSNFISRVIVRCYTNRIVECTVIVTS